VQAARRRIALYCRRQATIVTFNCACLAAAVNYQLLHKVGPHAQKKLILEHLDVLMNDAQLCHLFTLAAVAETPRERLLNQWHRAGDIPNYLVLEYGSGGG
jgi:hypothetical protein